MQLQIPAFSALIQNLPFNTKAIPIPNIDTRPQLREHIPLTTGYLIKFIQDGTQVQPPNILRLALWYRMANGNYSNQEFVSLLTKTVDYVDCLIGTNQASTIEQAITQAAGDLTSCYAAREMQLNPAFNASLTDADRNNALQWINYFGQISNMVQTYMNRVNQMNNGYGMINNGQQQQWQQPQQQQWGNQQQWGGGNTGGTWGVQQHQNSQQMGYSGGGNVGWGSAAAGGPVSTTSGRGSDLLAAVGGAEQPIQPLPVTQQQPQQQQVQQPVVVVPATPQHTAPTITFNGGEVTYAVQQVRGITDPVQFLGNTPPVLYIGGKHVAFYAYGKNGFMNYVTLKEDAALDYIKHETEHLIKPRHSAVRSMGYDPAEAARVLKEIEAARKLTELKKKLEKAGKTAGDGSTETLAEHGPSIQIVDPVLDDMSGDYHAMATTALAEVDPSLTPENSVVSMTVVDVWHWQITEETAVILARAMGKSKTWIDLRNSLFALSGSLPFYFWDQLEKAITRQVNEHLFVGLETDLSIASFVDNIEEVLNILRDEMPDLLKIFNNQCLKRTLATTACFDNTDVIRRINNLSDDAAVPQAFVTVEDVTLLPIYSSQLSFCGAGNLLLVNQGVTPELFSAIQHRFKTKRKDVSVVKLITLDNATYYAFESVVGMAVMLGNTNDFTPK